MSFALIVSMLITLAGSVSPALSASVVRTHVYVVIDVSKTYEHREDALRLVNDFVQAAQVVPRDPRRQPASRLAVTIITVDSFPRVVFSGSEFDLQQKLDRDWWSRLFADRQAYATCSDVAAALALVVKHLPADADRCVEQPVVYLLTDFLQEPAARGSRCKAASYEPRAMPLAALAGVPVRAFWVPRAASEAWEPELRRMNLDESFIMYPTAGPDGRLVVPPPRRCAPSEADRAAIVARITHALMLVAALFVAAVAMPVGFALRRHR